MPQRDDQGTLIHRFLRALFARNAYAESRPDQPDHPIAREDNQAQDNSLAERETPRARRSFGRGGRFASGRFAHEVIVTGST
jgi:hypothetical protein